MIKVVTKSKPVQIKIDCYAVSNYFSLQTIASCIESSQKDLKFHPNAEIIRLQVGFHHKQTRLHMAWLCTILDWILKSFTVKINISVLGWNLIGYIFSIFLISNEKKINGFQDGVRQHRLALTGHHHNKNTCFVFFQHNFQQSSALLDFTMASSINIKLLQDIPKKPIYMYFSA